MNGKDKHSRGNQIVPANVGIRIESENLNIIDLLNSYSSEIASVRKIVEKETIYHKGDNSSRYDDIWILRFLLSHKQVKDAAKAAVKTMYFREEMKLNEMGDIRHRAPSMKVRHRSDQFESFLLYYSFCKSDETFLHQLPDPDRGVVSYIRASEINLKGIEKDMPTKDLHLVYTMYNECVFQIVDSITRRTGKLVKVVKVVDMDGFCIRDCTIGYAKKDAAANKISENFYPQLLGSVIFVNCSNFVSGLWKVISKLYSQRAREKIAFIGKNPSQSEMKLMRKYVADKDIPEMYGGSNRVWPQVDELIDTLNKKGGDEQNFGNVHH